MHIIFKYSITTAGHSKAVDGAVCTAGRGYEAPGVFPHHPPRPTAANLLVSHI